MKSKTFKFPDTRVLLFAREPVYGQVKTRLHASIGRRRAFDLHCAMLRYQVDNIQHSGLAPLELWVDGNPENPEIASLPLQEKARRQQGEDLGQRMRMAVQSARSRAEAVVLVGTDCPSIDRGYLEYALEKLASGKQVVIGPAEDGGYVLLGVRDSWPQLFLDIPWGGDRVMTVSRQRIDQLGLDCEILPERWDVDRPEDLARLASLSPPLNFEFD